MLYLIREDFSTRQLINRFSTKTYFLALAMLVLGGVVISSGCHREEPYYPVSGTVLLNGEPLVGANVIFEPAGDSSGIAKGVPSYGHTDRQGHYKLKALLVSKDGAVSGQHLVKITSAGVEPFTQEQIADARAKLKSDAEAAGVANSNISDKDVDQYLQDFGPPRKLRRETVPDRYHDKSELIFIVKAPGTSEADFSLTSP